MAGIVCIITALLGVSVPRLWAQACGAQTGRQIEKGWTAYRSGDVAAAYGAFKTALAACPASIDALTGMSYVALRQGRTSSAKSLADSVLKLQPRNVDALVARAMAATRDRDYARAQKLLQRATQVDSTRADVRDMLAQLPAGMGAPPARPPLVVPDTIGTNVRTANRSFEILREGRWQPFYVKGINLGAALPGKNPSEFPDSSTYAQWIAQMHELGANTIRVYTIHPPQFYQALLQFNQAHATAPLWLIHGVWTELPPASHYDGAAFESAFKAEMRRVVNLLHGRADIPPAPGHASGFYTADVSPYVLAFIIGREWEPKSVVAFNKQPRARTSYAGRFLSIAKGNAMEAWLTAMCDYMTAVESDAYHVQHPIAFTNWPTLDPLTHPTETTIAQEMAIRRALHDRVIEAPHEYDNDIVSLDANHTQVQPSFKAGYFASYHAYPYYPDFMIYDSAYYAGYLRALVRYHAALPVLISEYGVPVSLGIAHLQPQGFHHGGHSEAEGAALNAQLTREIAESGAAGGAFFSWIDEWFKKNWVTIDFEQPADRNRLWLNRLDAEQQYGVIAMEAGPPFAQQTLLKDSTLELQAAEDEACLRLTLSARDSLGDVVIGFDVIDPQRGDVRLPNKIGARLPVGVELALLASHDTVRVVADSASNPFRVVTLPRSSKRAPRAFPVPANPPAGFFTARVQMILNRPFTSVLNADGVYTPLLIVTNRRRFGRDTTEYLAAGYDRGILRQGAAPDGNWTRTPHTLEVRIPWMLLNFSDPSSGRVVQGASGTTVLTRAVDSIRLVVARKDAGGSWQTEPVATFHLQTWEQPHWQARTRPTFDALKAVFDSIPLQAH